MMNEVRWSRKVAPGNDFKVKWTWGVGKIRVQESSQKQPPLYGFKILRIRKTGPTMSQDVRGSWGGDLEEREAKSATRFEWCWQWFKVWEKVTLHDGNIISCIVYTLDILDLPAVYICSTTRYTSNCIRSCHFYQVMPPTKTSTTRKKDRYFVLYTVRSYSSVQENILASSHSLTWGRISGLLRDSIYIYIRYWIWMEHTFEEGANTTNETWKSRFRTQCSENSAI